MSQLKTTAIIIILTGVLSCTAAFALTDADVETAYLVKRGDALFAGGRIGDACRLFEKAISGIRPEEDIKSRIYVCLRLAECYKALGWHKKAIPFFKESLPFLKKSGDRHYNALFLAGLADLWLTAGEPENGLRHIRDALELAKMTDNRRLLATVLNIAGNFATWSRDFETGLQYYTGALQMLDSASDTDRLKMKLLMNRIRLLVFMKDSKGVKELSKALRIMEGLPDGYFKASCLMSAYTVGEEIPGWIGSDDSKGLLKKTLELARELKNAKFASLSCGWWGELHEKAGRFKKAAGLTRQAVFFAGQGDYPEILYQWQWQMGRILAAEKDFKGALKFYARAIETLNPIRTRFFSGYRYKGDFFNAKIKAVYLGMAELLINQAANTADKSLQRKRLVAARDAMEILKTAELENFFQDECSVMAGKGSGGLKKTPDNAVLLHPISLENSLVVLATLPDGMEYRRVNVGQVELGETVRRLRTGLQNRSNSMFMHDARKLYTWLIAPFEEIFEHYGVDTLVMAPDGVLRLIPFSALYDGKGFLVERYALGVISALSLTDFGRLDVTEKKDDILITGLSEGVMGFSGLPAVKEELVAIKEIMGASGFYLDQEHNLKNLKREFKAGAYSMVHMATHGVFGHNAKNTFLLLHDERLDMNQLANLLDTGGSGKRPVELLTLSACQTALGDERAALGLAGVAVKAGVKSVMATLWFVDDEATSFVIREFYRGLKGGIPKARALQRAQKKLMEKKRYRHPAYWAPFLLIGNWR